MIVQSKSISLQQADFSEAAGKTLILKIDIDSAGNIKSAQKTIIKSEA